MDVNDITFGVEVTVPRATCPVGGYHYGTQIPGLPPGWKAERDGSIRAAEGHEACEVVSPVLKGADGLRQLKAVGEWFARVGAKDNASCGFHVHVGFDPADRDGLRRLVHLVANFERPCTPRPGRAAASRGTTAARCRTTTARPAAILARVVSALSHRA